MDHHNNDNPKNKGGNLMLTVTGLPVDLDEYIDFSMITQSVDLFYLLGKFFYSIKVGFSTKVHNVVVAGAGD